MSSASAVPSAVSSQDDAPPSNKRRKVEEPQMACNTSRASDLQVLHQSTELSLLYLRHPQSSWHAQGRTTLYVINNVPGNFAMHLRGSCQVLNVTVETLKQTAETTNNAMEVDGAPPDHVSLVSVPVDYQHTDPLGHVLVKPVQSQSPEGYHADSQWIRGATGMTLGLRAASIASLMGELRITPAGSSSTANEAPVSKDDAMQYWMHDLQASSNKEGEVAEELTTKLHSRSTRAREARIQLVAQRLAEASQLDSKNTDKPKVMKVTIMYEVALDRMPHLGGIHNSHGQTPHVYTTAGVFGDHEGPRTWIPCLDSASSKHRASHELVIRVTAPMRDGLSVVGCGEDFGVTKTLLHDMSIPPRAAQQLGSSHVQMVNNIVAKAMTQNEQASEDGIAPHVIPPDPSSVDSVLATTVWASQVWAPAPIRSLGFAVGPFKILEDPEYFSGENDDDEDVEEENETDQNAFIEAARENGEGIRQAYFAPLYERKYIHLSADMTLLEQTTFELPQMSQRFVEASRDLDQAVIVSTAGVTLRALSLFRDVLALPTYRTSSYTQIWIPDAVHGGSTSGALHCCPEVFVNPFIGGSIMDARLLSPVGSRLPYYCGGRVLQMIQARCVVRGWITAALPLGEDDDVGFGYIYTLIESFLMSIYERGHGAFGEGGAKSSIFFTRRYASKSGLNSSVLDFLPIANIEEAELEAVAGGVVGGLPIEDRSSDQLWRTASNGTESHTSALDELGVRQVLYKDSVEALERATDKKNDVALPSTGYLGSHLSLSFLSTNASSSSELGCGAMELLHPVGGMTYRVLKSELLQRVVEGRAGTANCIRLIRAAFIAAHLEDSGRTELKDEDWKSKPKQKKMTEKARLDEKGHAADHGHKMRPPFLLCVDELLKKHGLSHALFTRALRILAGPMREPLLRGSLVDVERETRMPVNGRHYVEPEGFPNSFVRGASELYLRVGAHVEPAGAAEAAGLAPSGVSKGIVLQLLAEPVIPEGAISYGGPITIRIVENEGQLREFARSMNVDGSRCDWGPIFLHAKPVVTTKQQNAASGGIETGRSNKPSSKSSDDDKGGASAGDSNTAQDAVFSDSCLHNGGFQAIELVRLTNRTPLLWVRVDPTFSYGGRIAIVQPDACIAEQLFHDGDAGAQVDALRALAERPFRIQGSVKIATVYGADVSELPVRVIGDCLRGSPALHSSLPHTPAVRAQAAYAIAQWQNNKEATNKLAGKTDAWVGLKLLVQYFRERFDDNGSIIPISFARVVIKKSEDQMGQASNDAGVGSSKTGDDALYQYLDTVETPEERRSAIKEAEDIEIEEDEEYRVRSAVVQAIASIRADDGTTPPSVLRLLEEVLQSGDSSMIGAFVSGVGDIDTHRLSKKDESDLRKRGLCHDDTVASLKFSPSIMVADAILSLCSVNASTAPTSYPATAQQEVAKHPSLPLISTCYRWLEWALYRETVRSEAESTFLTGVGGGTQSTVAACAITSLCSLCILKQSTTDPAPEPVRAEHRVEAGPQNEESVCDVASSAQYYKAIFDGEPLRNDVTRAACAQAVACIYCAADRVKIESKEPLGLLNALEFLLERILDPRTSPGLRQTLALLMMDACTGKICSTQRVGVVGGRGDLCTSAARLLTGPLGSSYGGDNGSALLMSVNEISYPAANAVNDGARRGLALLKVAGGMNDDKTSNQSIVRIAKFATSLWRTINGDCAPPPSATASRVSNDAYGICSYDGLLRCSLLSLWQWLWPSRCSTVMRVQTWEKLMGKQQYEQLGANLVMHSTEAEMKAANEEEKSLAAINHIVEKEIDRQKWRGEMTSKAYEYYQFDKARKALPDPALTIDQGVGQPLPMVVRDAAFKQGGWIASAAQQRRADKLDGGCKVTAVRLKMKSASSGLES